jgi:uncharacterized phage protein (TIGR02218 family)
MGNIAKYEDSQQDGIPVECYKFIHAGMSYLYTSAAHDIEIPITESGITRTEKYFAEVISRGAIKPGNSGSVENCTIKVSKDNAIAKLFQGAPPEIPVTCSIYRLHEPDLSKFDAVLQVEIGQAKFSDSECELTANMDSWLNKELPNGMNQYYCNHVIFDHNCGLQRADYLVSAMLDKVDGKTILYSSKFAEYPDGYFTGGRLYYDDNVRMIFAHKGNQIQIKYPFTNIPHNTVQVLPGCDTLFRTCALRYKNTLHFSGVPYVAPTDATKNPTGQGAYWVDSLVIRRDTDGFIGTIDL